MFALMWFMNNKVMMTPSLSLFFFFPALLCKFDYKGRKLQSLSICYQTKKQIISNHIDLVPNPSQQ